MNHSSNIKDHRSQITITNIIIMKYQNVTQRHEATKCYWKNCAKRLNSMQGCHTLSICTKHSISTVNKAKFNKARYACICIYSIVIVMQAISEKKRPNSSFSFHFYWSIADLQCCVSYWSIADLQCCVSYWSIADLQCCVSYYCTAKWISYTYIHPLF